MGTGAAAAAESSAPAADAGPAEDGEPRLVISEPTRQQRHDRGKAMLSATSSIGHTPRFKAALEKGTFAVDSTDGVRLCVKTWPSPETESQPLKASERLLVVLVHQYSVMGGCQDLVAGLATNLNRLGFSCVTFDQRGVGGSTGSKSLTGVPEVDDVVSVCQWALEKHNRRILLVGSSAGAPVAGSALDKVKAVDGYVGIGYVFGMWASVLFGSHFKRVLDSPKPKLFIMGTRDGFTTPKQLKQKLASAKGTNETYFFEGYGHFEIESPTFDEPLAKLVAAFGEKVQEGQV